MHEELWSTVIVKFLLSHDRIHLIPRMRAGSDCWPHVTHKLIQLLDLVSHSKFPICLRVQEGTKKRLCQEGIKKRLRLEGIGKRLRLEGIGKRLHQDRTRMRISQEGITKRLGQDGINKRLLSTRDHEGTLS